jgi:cyclophilin family peptidyl-prolyl cis-trans isomerase
MSFQITATTRSLSLLALLPIAVAACSAHRGTAAPVPASVLRNPKDPYWSQQAPEKFKVKFETTKGDFILEVVREMAPHGVDRFYNLVRAHFYDDSRFFRVRENWIAMFGIPGNPAIGTLWQNETIPDDPPKGTGVRGTINFAKTGPNTRTTQLSINLVDNSARLDRAGFGYIGSVISGMEVVDKLYNGYGETAGGAQGPGRQGRLFSEGNAYLDKEFPKLDKIIRMSVVR